jgi:hypothetical protein
VPAETGIETIALPSAGGPEAVEALRERLLAALAAGSAVHLDARDLSEPSTALVQLIETAAADFAGRGLACALVEPSDALCQAYEDLGLYGALMSRIFMSA